jgi:hypothetical protein
MVVSPLMALSSKAAPPMLCLLLAGPADLPTDAEALLLALAALPWDGDALSSEASALPLEADALLAASLLALPEPLPLGVEVLPLDADALPVEADPFSADFFSALRDDLRAPPSCPSCSSFCDSA